MGSGIGLALGAGYMAAGMAQAVSDHHRAARIAEAAQGGFSETMLQRETNGMDPAALRVARAHDDLTPESVRAPAQGLPPRLEARQPAGRHGSGQDSARQLNCLTEAVYFEARGETPRGQAAVAQVVLNRVKNPAFPKTVCAVVFQGAARRGCQFSFACDGSMRHGLEPDAWERARRIAERALTGRVLADIGAATHFHTADVQPDWGPQMLRVAQVGLHVFYRRNPHAAPIAPSADGPVLAGLPTPPGSNLRLATAVLEKAADVSVAAVSAGASADAKANAKPEAAAPAAKSSEPAAAPRPVATDAAAAS